MFTSKIWKFFAPEAATAGAPAAASTDKPAAAPAAAPASDSGAGPAEPGRDATDRSEYSVENLKPGSAEYREWQKTGKMPKRTAAQPTVEGEGEEAEAGDEDLTETGESSTSTAATAAGAQPANQPQKGKKGAQRYQELVDLVKQKDAELAELRKPKVTAETRAESQPAATAEVPEPTMDDTDPKTGKYLYTTVDDYNKARDAWLENRLLSKTEKNLEQRTKERLSQQQAREITDRYRNRLDKAREKYADFDAVAMNENLPIPADTAMEGAIVLSEHGAEMAYMLGKNPAEAARIAKLPPFEQAREMFLVELLAGGFDSYLTKDPRFAGKFSSAPAKPKKVTAVPDSPAEIGGQGVVLSDEVEQAAANADKDDRSVRAFIDAKNRRAVARRKGN